MAITERGICVKIIQRNIKVEILFALDMMGVSRIIATIKAVLVTLDATPKKYVGFQ